MKYWILPIWQRIKWIPYRKSFKFVYKGYYTFFWNIPDILHKWRWGQPGDNGLPLTHNCKYGWKHMTPLERESRAYNLGLDRWECKWF
jgi:hypothetical protein